MDEPARWMCLVIVFALLSLQGALAQEPSEAWVSEIGAPWYFAVLVEDVDRSVDWYRSVLGLRERGGSEAGDGSWRIENLGNGQLHVEIVRDDRAREVERPRGFFKVGFEVPDVEVVADRVATATGQRPEVLDFERFGVRIIQLRDPDDNIIQLSSPLEATER